MRFDSLSPGDWFWLERIGVRTRCMVIHELNTTIYDYVAVCDDGQMVTSLEVPPETEVLPARGPRG